MNPVTEQQQFIDAWNSDPENQLFEVERELQTKGKLPFQGGVPRVAGQAQATAPDAGRAAHRIRGRTTREGDVGKYPATVHPLS